MNREKPLVMIVDDEPINLDVLDAMLRQEHYEVSAFLSGGLALDAALEIEPDLILLDIRMPVMNGYEVCQRLKRNERLSQIPVIFLSALSDTQDKLRAFEAGAVDYISKPLSQPEVLARVRVHLELNNKRLLLEDLVHYRTQTLEAANRRLKALDDVKTHWINMLAHEVRTPLTGVLGIADALFRELPPASSLQEFKEAYDFSCDRIRKLIDDATLLAAIHVGDSAFAPETVSLTRTLEDAIRDARKGVADVEFVYRPHTERALYVSASPSLLIRAMRELLITAGLCTAAEHVVSVSTHADGQSVVIEIATQGKSLPDAELAVFFDVGEQRTLHKGGADFGLGPALAQRLLQLFDGRASVRNRGSEGIVLSAALPGVSPTP